MTVRYFGHRGVYEGIVSVVGTPDLQMFPANPDYIQIHTRRYEVRAVARRMIDGITSH
jgi:hypothetical protein